MNGTELVRLLLSLGLFVYLLIAQQVQETHYLRVFMANLRRKLEVDPAQPRYLLTEQGVGYRLASE